MLSTGKKYIVCNSITIKDKPFINAFTRRQNKLLIIVCHCGYLHMAGIAGDIGNKNMEYYPEVESHSLMRRAEIKITGKTFMLFDTCINWPRL